MGSIPIPIETSARHIHLCPEHIEVLFGTGTELTPVRNLSQPGQFACAQRVSIEGPKDRLENVSVLGPARSATQVELSMTDCRKIGIPGVIRQSGYIDDTPGCIIRGPYGELELERGVIVAKRHIHMHPREARAMHVRDNDNVFVITKSFERALIFADVVVRVNKDYNLAMHVDTDEANAFAGDEAPYGVILKLFEGNTYNLQKWAEEILDGINRG